MAQVNNPFKSKKGFFISLSVFLLASTLVLLAYALSLGQGARLDAIQPALAAKGAGDLARMAGEGARSILLASGVGASSTSSNISYWSTFPPPANLSADLSAWEVFLSTYSDGANISINALNASRPQVYLKPQDITLDFANSTFYSTPNSASYSQGNISSYSLALSLNGSGAVTITYNSSTVLNSSAGALLVNIFANTTSGNASFSNYINRSLVGGSEFSINQSGNVAGWLRFEPNASLELELNNTNASFNLTIGMAPNSAPPYAELPQGSIISAGGNNILYNATVRLD